MNYLLTYWLDPNSAPEREDSLRTYFDLQRFTKEQFGATQTIVTNIDYDAAIPFEESVGFTREYGMFAKYFGLGQAIENGLEFPIAMHDHDTFIRDALAPNNNVIQCMSKSGNYFSDQLVVFPEKSKSALTSYINILKKFEFQASLHSGYGTEVRHEKMYSTEVTIHSIKPFPFADIPIEITISFRDLVSFDILEHHSLDKAHCECDPIPENTQVVHGHLNKGPATEALVEWLSTCPKNSNQ